jgi:regulatory protein
MDAYTTALTLLARRELSAEQLRARLLRHKLQPAAIDAAIERLTRDRTLDDRRVALAAARVEATIKGHGKRRVLQSLQRLGVSADIAKTAVDEVFSDVDEIALLDRAIAKRLKGAPLCSLDRNAKARIVRRLVAQGFAPSQVFARLRSPTGSSDAAD